MAKRKLRALEEGTDEFALLVLQHLLEDVGALDVGPVRRRRFPALIAGTTSLPIWPFGAVRSADRGADSRGR